MSSYSYLRIGKLTMPFRSSVPNVVTFLFTPQQFFVEESSLEAAERARALDEDYLPGFGFRTSASDALRTLDENGFDLSFCVAVYAELRSNLRASVRSELQRYHGPRELGPHAFNYITEQIDIDRYMAESLGRTPAEEIHEYIDFLELAADTERIEALFREHPVRFELNGKVHDDKPRLDFPGQQHIANMETLLAELLKRPTAFSCPVVTVGSLFISELWGEYPEIIELAYVRLLLEASTPEDEVRLEVSEVIEDEEEARSLHTSAAFALAEKVNLYNRVFHSLTKSEQSLRLRYAQAQARSLLSEASEATDSQAKGLALEELLSTVLGSEAGLPVVERRFSTGDEEIDIVVKNNVNQPFWIALSSPLIFFECKNWRARVGASEFRDFEAKLRNHTLAKIGVFVAFGGVTAKFFESMRRATREPYTVVLLQREDLERFARTHCTVLELLEDRLTKPL